MSLMMMHVRNFSFIVIYVCIFIYIYQKSLKSSNAFDDGRWQRRDRTHQAVRRTQQENFIFLDSGSIHRCPASLPDDDAVYTVYILLRLTDDSIVHGAAQHTD